VDLSRHLLIALAAASTTILTGCGSSSSSRSEAQIGADIPTVVLSGFVTDNPIQDATVTATVNGQTFTSDQPTASDGSYQIEISSENPDALVRLEAIDPSGTTRLSAIVDSFEAIEDAVEDTSSDEDFNVTNVTTAREVLAKRLTDDGSIDSKEELLDAVARVETDDLLEVSAAIKLVVDNIDGVTLPTDASDTLALAEAIVSGDSTFIEDVAVSAPGALENALDQVLTDGNATIAFTADSVPGVYVSSDSFSMFAFFAGGFGYTEPQGEGSAAMFDWQVTEAGVLNLFIGGSAPRTEAVTLLGRTDNIVNVVVREDGATDSGEATTAHYYAFEGAFTEENVPGSYSTLNDPGHLTVFEADGSGQDLNVVTGVTESEFTWSVDESGMLTLADSDGSVTTARRLTGSTDDSLLLFVAEQDATGDLDNVSLAEVLRSDAEIGSNEANALLLAGSTYAMTESDEQGLFAFRTDGSFHEIVQHQDGADGSWSVDEGTGTWAVDANGAISIAFPNDPTATGAQVVSGLGEDIMVVQPNDSESSVMQVLRVVAADSALVVGSFSIQDEATGTVSETVRLLANGTGTHVGADGVGEDFTWRVSSDGRLVVTTSGDTAFDTHTLTFYMLTGSSGDLLRFIAVERVNGVLREIDPSSTEMPDTLMVVTMIRNS
jgi:hypothetical protein